MMKRVLTFVSGLQESVLLDLISQNKVKICMKSKLVKIVFIKNFLTKMKKNLYFFYIFVNFGVTFMRSFI